MYARHVSMNLKPNKGDEFTQTLELVGSQGERGRVKPRDLSPSAQEPSESG